MPSWQCTRLRLLAGLPTCGHTSGAHQTGRPGEGHGHHHHVQVRAAAVLGGAEDHLVHSGVQGHQAVLGGGQVRPRGHWLYVTSHLQGSATGSSRPRGHLNLETCSRGSRTTSGLDVLTLWACPGGRSSCRSLCPSPVRRTAPSSSSTGRRWRRRSWRCRPTPAWSSPGTGRKPTGLPSTSTGWRRPYWRPTPPTSPWSAVTARECAGWVRLTRYIYQPITTSAWPHEIHLFMSCAVSNVYCHPLSSLELPSGRAVRVRVFAHNSVGLSPPVTVILKAPDSTRSSGRWEAHSGHVNRFWAAPLVVALSVSFVRVVTMKWVSISNLSNVSAS